jgi:hypothetical protein
MRDVICFRWLRSPSALVWFRQGRRNNRLSATRFVASRFYLWLARLGSLTRPHWLVPIVDFRIDGFDDASVAEKEWRP